MIIRTYDCPQAGPDTDAVAALLRETHPHLVLSGAALHAQAVASPARGHFRLLIAEDGGRLVGCARAGRFADVSDPGLGFANLAVRAADRGHGTGGALLAAAEAHLAGIGVRTVHAWADDTPAAHTFAVRRGYRRGRSAGFHRLDLGEGSPLPAPPDLPAGVRLLPATHWADDPRPLYETDLECFQDEPGDVPADAIGYADWRAITWDRPDFDPALSTAAVADGQVAAFVIAQTDGERYWSGGTGTRRAFRGRGLATAAKTYSLRLARARGLRAAYTGNDDGNAAMPAVNRRLGYEPCGTEWRYSRDLTDRT
ncbi:GNAT family N-acetyltransferase [Streptomyces sp. NBC_01476]|uniref:GNAT family N-acetyltransferase n=1 Tax=Streptomyces sp. NBC_01476 TaxID=2903881 RepID=UPI002E366184|nr:GNAT family N-acetyltransferase [Streptomyces sp. NBC_01476]